MSYFALFGARLTFFPFTVSVTPLPCPNHTRRSCFAWKTSWGGGWVFDFMVVPAAVISIQVGESRCIVATMRVAPGGLGSPFDAGGTAAGAAGDGAGARRASPAGRRRT